jgi:hypothetical protein
MKGGRSRVAMSHDERPTISIQIDGGEAIHGVDLQLLSLLSSCARGLPADAACWDLSQVLVSLNCCFSICMRMPMEKGGAFTVSLRPYSG